jgi:hypothetical protein
MTLLDVVQYSSGTGGSGNSTLWCYWIVSCPWNVTFILPSTIRAFGTAFKKASVATADLKFYMAVLTLDISVSLYNKETIYKERSILCCEY